jgi:hypothetical protein
MPGKSRRKDKFSLKNKAGNGQPAVATSSSVTATKEPVVRTPAAAPSTNVSTRNAKPSVIPSSLYINREILTITLLAGLMLVLLIVAAFIAR